MAYQIIRQPNGKYCIFSTVVDNVTMYNLTEDEIIDEFVKEQKINISEQVKLIIKSINEGRKPYYQFTKDFNSMLEFIKEIHGEDESNEVKAAIEKAE